MIYTYHFGSPLGKMTMAGNANGLTALWFDGQKYFGSKLPDVYKEEQTPIFEQAVRWLEIYFSGIAPDFTPPLSIEATPFRKTVWQILLDIPYGKTMTYGEIAQKVREINGITAMSAQAVGGAVAHNPISLIIPCHRVIGANKSLTGYAGGIERKRQLLTLEKVEFNEK